MKKILICDDSSFTRKRMASFLNEIDADITHADNGKAALDIIEQQSPDLVLLDLLMPEIDGIGVLTKLKENSVDIPVVVISADIQQSTIDQCMELGAKKFLNKPVTKEKLNNEIEEFLS